eukprot:COSAG06_NODE_44700_length_361_cov_0.839695_1_plen_56_part_01
MGGRSVLRSGFVAPFSAALSRWAGRETTAPLFTSALHSVCSVADDGICPKANAVPL